MCNGGARLPRDQAIECGNEISFYWRTVIIGTVLGGVTFLAAVAGLVLLYLRNKRLYVAYNSLKNNTIPLDSEGPDDSHNEFVNEFNSKPSDQ